MQKLMLLSTILSCIVCSAVSALTEQEALWLQKLDAIDRARTIVTGCSPGPVLHLERGPLHDDLPIVAPGVRCEGKGLVVSAPAPAPARTALALELGGGAAIMAGAFLAATPVGWAIAAGGVAAAVLGLFF